jgi:Protein of unknown function (DUF3108)
MRSLLIVLVPFLLALDSMIQPAQRVDVADRSAEVSARSTMMAADSADSATPPPYTSMDDLRVLVNKAFNVGEKLNYDVYYGPINAGSATIETPSSVYYEGRKTLKVEFSMRSAPFFDFFFKVRDYYYSLIDAQGLFPWKFEQHIREGGYKKDFTAWFDQCNHTAKTSEGGPFIIQPYTQDAVSTFFFARTMDYDTLSVGSQIHFSNFYQNKVYPLDVKYLGREDIKTKAGRFHCQVIEPVIVKGGLFKNTGKITVWITDDSLKIPVRVKTEVVIGSVVAELTGFSGLAGIPTARY